MPRTTPEEAFAEARGAMERGDWEGVFACIDRDEVLRIAENGISRFLVGGEATVGILTALCEEHGVPREMVSRLRDALERTAESAKTSVALARGSDPAAMVQESLRHKQVVDEYRRAQRDTLKAVPDIARFTAALERALRAASGGGSVSSRLFVGEDLAEVSIAGAQAWGTRRLPGGHSEDVGFKKRKDGWSIRILAKRPGPRRD